MYGSGIKASELIAKLQALIDQHGDRQVIVGGGDYPEGAEGVRYNKQEQPYYPANSFVVF